MAKTSKRRPKKSISPAPTNSRELLLEAARNVFALEGYDRASTREIAKSAGVNISLISYHFQGKEGLFRACIEEMSSSALETIERVLKKPASIDEFKTRLQIFIEEFIRLHLKHPGSSCIVMREMSGGTPNGIVMDLFKTKFMLIFDRLVEYFTYSQKQKYVAAHVDVELASTMLMGCISHIMRTENLRSILLGREGFLEPKNIENTVAQMARCYLEGIIPRSELDTKK